MIGALVAAPALLGSCSLVVDTGGLSGEAPVGDAAPNADATTDAAEGGSATDGAAIGDPCADPTLAFCERFDTPEALGRFTPNTDATTRISVDGAGFVSAPGSARFEIDPDANNVSPDATLAFTTKAALARVAVDGWVKVERSEAAQPARLFLMNVAAQGSITIDRSGKIRVLTTLVGSIPEPPSGQWFHLGVELSTDAVPPTLVVVVDGMRSEAFRIGTVAWQPGPVSVRFGISEANSPSTGWLVRWDDVRVKSF